MKKIYFILSFTLFAFFSNAQTYYPMLDSAVNIWNYTTNYIPVRLEQPAVSSNCIYPNWFSITMTEQTTSDSVINSFSYKRIEVSADLNSNTCLFGFVREDTAARKVYFIDNAGNPEILLYDFSMQIGDTMSINFIASNGYYAPGVYQLDSITTINIHAGARRAFHLNNHTSNTHTLTWVESVGALTDAFYTVSMNTPSSGWFWNCSPSPHDCIQFMTCFDHQSKVYYDSCAWNEALMNGCIFIQDTCNYWNICGLVNEISQLNDFSVYPNPSAGSMTISLVMNRKSNLNLIIHNMTGEQTIREIALGAIPDGKTERQIDLSELPDGFYLAEIRSAEGSAFRKLLIVH